MPRPMPATSWRRGSLALAVACLAAAPAARAQATFGAPSQASPARLLDATLSTLAQAPAANPALVASADDDTRSRVAEAAATIQVNGFRITGNTVFSDAELQPLLAAWVGRRLAADQLLDAAEALRNRYKDAGYFLTQVLVPPQRPQDGVVTLRVVEARLGTAHARVDSRRVDAARIEAYLRLLPEGTDVTEQDVQRPLLLISDLAGVRIESTLSPGAAPGQADLLVTVSDAPRAVRGDAYADNQGDAATGRLRLGADVIVDGAIGAGESWTLGGLASQGGGVKAVRGAVTFPVGPYGAKATLSAAHVDYRVGGAEAAALDANGRAEVGALDLRHPLVRSRNLNVYLSAGAALLVVDDSELGGLLHDRRQLPSANLGLEGDFRDEDGGGAINTWDARLDAGDNDIRTAAQSAADRAPTGHATSGAFERLSGDFQRLQSLGSNTSVLVSARGQLAFQNLDASQKAGVGGPDGVRAFASGDGVGDDAFVGTVELRQRVPGWTLRDAGLLVDAFIDGGRVRAWHRPTALDTTNIATVGGYGIGLNLSRRDNFQFRLDVAQKINRDSVVESDHGRTRVWVSLTESFR